MYLEKKKNILGTLCELF